MKVAVRRSDDCTSAPDTAAPPAGKTYTVKAGDTLSAIAKEHLGSAGAYMKIFEANKDQLTDPDKIKPGQVLHLPSRFFCQSDPCGTGLEEARIHV